MPLPGVPPAIRQQFDRFLHAVVERERNGMDLSVLSLMARLGLDPWAEARRLASLSTVAAAESLARSIMGLPGGSQPAAQARATAFGLVRLLPGHAAPPWSDAARPPSPEASGGHDGVWLHAGRGAHVRRAARGHAAVALPRGPDEKRSSSHAAPTQAGPVTRQGRRLDLVPPFWRRQHGAGRIL